MKATPAEQLQELRRGVVEILPEEDLLKKLEASYSSRKPLIVKFGADPSRPDIHLGHTVAINKLRVLQEFGHEVNFLIGDFTAQIGDPTGKNKVRQQLSEEEVRRNAQTYQDQVFQILDPAKTKIVYNSAWWNGIRVSRFLQILMNTTVVQLLARDDFSERYRQEQPIYLHEFLYPILQGYDSIEMKADIELGGTDQRFNLLMGRHLQKAFGFSQQVLMILPLLEGLDGVNKMSKSLDNTIALTESSKDMFGKIMSVSDTLMMKYYDLLSSRPLGQILQLKEDLESGKLHPMSAKKRLAEEIVDRYHGKGRGAEECQRFEELFSRKTDLHDLPTIDVQLNGDGKADLVTLLVEQGFAKSRSDARRLIQQKAVKLDGQALTEEVIFARSNQILKIGKLNIVRIRLK